jgi:ParB-like nuclease family protein
VSQESFVRLESAEANLNVPAHPLDRPAKTQASETTERPVREGLPAAFKMRRERHYVEQLMGEAPLRTVREIPVNDIDPPDTEEAVDVEELQRSIKDVGILQPLLLAPAGNRFRIIAGGNRYRAAVQLGLRTVPSVVYESGAHSVDALREAAARRAAPPAEPEPQISKPSDESRRLQPAAGLREVTARLAFVSAVMPALDVAGYDPLRWNILTDLMKVEMERARSTAAAVEWLSSKITPGKESFDAAAVLDKVLEAVGAEARLQGVKLDVSSTVTGYRLAGDAALIARALTGLVQSMLTLSSSGSTLRIEANGTSVRPALIVSVAQDDCELPSAAIDRFFDGDYAQHPTGPSGALVLAGLAHIARLHGGRVHTLAKDGGGLTATFVIPKPLDN